MGGRLDGKKALLYGGGTGIGLACAEAMLREGAAVFLSGRREAVLAEAAERLAAAGSVGYAAGDATSADDVQRVTAAAVEAMGGLDTILVSAGAGGPTPIFDTAPDEFQRIMDNNLRPAFLAVRYGAEHLLAAGRASVILLASTYGLVGHAERVAYCGAKAGVIGMAKAMAMDFAERGVTVNALCPGYIETPLSLWVAQQEDDPEAELRAKRSMHPIPRAGRLEEVAEMAVYLASDLAAFTTGQAIAVDGGYSAR